MSTCNKMSFYYLQKFEFVILLKTLKQGERIWRKFWALNFKIIFYFKEWSVRHIWMKKKITKVWIETEFLILYKDNNQLTCSTLFLYNKLSMLIFFKHLSIATHISQTNSNIFSPHIYITLSFNFSAHLIE